MSDTARVMPADTRHNDRPEPARFIVDELGPRSFAVRDTRTEISYDPRFTRKAAQQAADWHNQRETP